MGSRKRNSLKEAREKWVFGKDTHLRRLGNNEIQEKELP
jgi:hypothetical protein